MLHCDDIVVSASNPVCVSRVGCRLYDRPIPHPKNRTKISKHQLKHSENSE